MKDNERNIVNTIIDSLDYVTIKYYEYLTNSDYELTSVMNYNVEKHSTNYYSCLFKIVNYFLDGDELNIYDEDLKLEIDNKLLEFRNYINDNKVEKKLITYALLHLDIKGFKNLNFSLDIITPDGISMIFAYLIDGIYSNYSALNILDFNIGVGNLLFTIASNIKNNVNLIGFDNHSLMADVSSMKANMLQTKLDIFFEDCLSANLSNFDLIVSDIATYDYENELYSSYLYDQGVTYFPYLAIEHFLELNKKIYAFYLIDSDFFNQKGSLKFKEMLDKKGSIKALISLPKSFFINDNITKSIIVIENNASELSTKKATEVVILPDANNISFYKVLENIIELLKITK